MQNPKELQSLQKSYTQEQQLIKYQHREIEATRYLSSIVAASNNQTNLMPAHKSPSVLFTNQAYASSFLPMPGYNIPTIDLSWIPDTIVVTAALKTAFRVAAFGVPLSTALGLEYYSGQQYASDIQKYTAISSGSNQDVTITSADYVLANARGVFDVSNSHDLEALTNIARGIAIERTSSIVRDSDNSGQTVPIWSVPTKPQPMNFREMGRVDYQGKNTWLTSYFDIDPNAGKPSVESFPITTQPRSILFTQDDRIKIAQWSKLPGLQEHSDDFIRTLVTPDQSDLGNSMNILFKKKDLDYSELSKKYFDENFRHLRIKVAEKANIKDIDPDVRERMAELINCNPSGRIIGIHNA